MSVRPNAYPQRSQLGQLLEPTDKGVSYQMIVIDSVTKQAEQIVMACKQSSVDDVELTQMQTIMMDRLTKFENVDDGAVEDAMKFMNELTEYMKTVVERMEESSGIMESLQAVFEGDRDIYEADSTPVARLLRKDDGTAMKLFEYGVTTKPVESDEL